MKNKRYIALIMTIILMFTMLTACRTAQKFDDVGAQVPKIPASVQTIVVDQTGIADNPTTVIVDNQNTTATESETTTTTNDTENTTVSTETTNAENTTSSNNSNLVADPDKPISCMSFNVLNGTGSNNNYSDPALRKNWVVEIIKEYDPDIVGFQEAAYRSISWKGELYNDLCAGGDYDMIVLDEQEECNLAQNTTGAGLIIVWKKDRFELKDDGCYEYSTVSKQTRYYQWVKLYDKVYDKTVYVTNTHLSVNSDAQSADQAGGSALRTSQANELYDFWKKIVTGDTVLFATGDYNSKLNEADHKIFQTGGTFMPSCEIAWENDGKANIDFVYTSPATVEVDESFTIERTFKDQVENQNLADTFYRASDHHPRMMRGFYK